MQTPPQGGESRRMAVVGFTGVQRWVGSALRMPPVDIVSGATVTVMDIGDSIIRSGKKVMQGLGRNGAGKAGPDTAPTIVKSVDPSKTGVEDWTTLIGDGSVRRLTLTVGEVNAAFERTGKTALVRRISCNGLAVDDIEIVQPSLDEMDPDATTADALSTALSAVPADRVPSILAAYPGVTARFTHPDGRILRLPA